MAKYFGKDKWKYLFHTMSHPADGYYWIRHGKNGSVPIALVLIVMFSLCFSFNRLLSSFIVNDVDPRAVDSFTELGGVLLLFALFCIGNWSITCLMGGEGRLKDITIALGYATLPLIVTYIPATFISNYIADGEEAFYYLILVIGITYAVIMALIGIMQVHNYTLGKTLLTLVLTIVAVFIIIFILLLLVNLVMQIYSFIYSLYIELVFRN